MTWGAIAVGGGALLGGLISGGAAKSAASTQAGAAENAQNISEREFNTITQQETPYMQSGYGALSQLDYLLGITPQTGGGQGGTGFNMPGGSGGSQNGYPGPFGAGGLNANGLSAFRGGTPTGYPGANQGSALRPTTGSPAGGFGSLVTPFTTANWQQLSPMYDFDVQQGRQGVLNQDTAGAGALSGSAMKDLINYNQGAANQSFGQAFNQYQTQQGNIFSRLSGIAQLGQSAAANTGQQGTALAGQAAQSATNIGTAQAAGTVGAANAYSGAISSALPWLYAAGGTKSPTADDPSSGFINYSDRRLKSHVTRIGSMASGLPFYSYKIRGKWALGVMADEAEQLFPDAVTTASDGYRQVDYSRIS